MTIESNEEVRSYNFLILVTSKPRFFKFTTSNTENLRNYKTFLLQILIIFYDMTIESNEEVRPYNFLILVTSKPRFFKFTTSNTENLRNYKTFLLQILIIFYDMTILSTDEAISCNFLINRSFRIKIFKVHQSQKGTSTFIIIFCANESFLMKFCHTLIIIFLPNYV